MKAMCILKKLFIAIIIITVLFLVYLTIVEFRCNTINDTIKNITSVFTCITASISVYVASMVRQENIENRKNDKTNTVTQSWYNKLIIEKNLPNIFAFFRLSNELIDVFQSIDDKKENMQYQQIENAIKKQVVEPFTKSFTSMQNELLADINIIDEELGKDILTDFESFQDEYFECMERKEPNFSNMKTVCIKAQNSVLKRLKDYQIKSVK